MDTGLPVCGRRFAGSDVLVARAQLDFISELVARFESSDSNMRPIADYQSQYIAIVAMLRSVGHVFEKVDCVDADRRAWSKRRWQVWKQDRIFSTFIEPKRNALLKEFRLGLQLHSDALDPISVVADPSLPAGASRLAGFDVGKLRDLSDSRMVNRNKIEAAVLEGLREVLKDQGTGSTI